MPSDERTNADAKRQKRIVVVKSDAAGESEAELLATSSESLEDVLSMVLSGREHVVMVRVNDETLRKLDSLVESGLCSSRSSAAAFVLHQGIESNPELFQAVEEATDQMSEVRKNLLQKIRHPRGDAEES